jgi:hypothetical protein
MARKAGWWLALCDVLMSFRTSLLPLLQTLRKLPSETFDIRTTSVLLRTRTWSDGEVGSGTYSDVDLPILPTPKCKKVSDTQLEVGPITPSNSAGGYTIAQLKPDDVEGTEWFYVCTGPDGVARRYTLLKIDQHKPFRYTLRLESFDRVAPF